MNFKKVLSIASVASLAVVGLVSCDKDDDKKESNSMDIVAAVDYNNKGYMTYGRGSNASKMADSYQTVDGRTLVKNSTITPIWQDIGANTNTNFLDGAPTGDNTKKVMADLITKNFVGYNDRKVQLLQVTANTDFTDAVDKGYFVNLSTYINEGKMPNLKKWLDSHESIKEQLTLNQYAASEGIYYTPYFDGLDTVECGFNMNIDMCRALLDDNAKTNKYEDDALVANYCNGTYDTTATITTQYKTPYIKSLNNQEIAVATESGTATKINVTIAEGEDIISRMEKLNVKNGQTLTECLKKYIDDVYGNYIGTGKLYANRSELFTSVSAAYNADELVALLRCVKTNPGYLTGNASTDMTPFFPRTGEANRVASFWKLAQIWGLRGVAGEQSAFSINADGKLVDGHTQEYSLYCLNQLRKLDKEGLFPSKDKWFQDGKTATNDYRKLNMQEGNAFMCYDYNNVAAFNKDVSNTATNKCSNMVGVLSPVAKWGFNTADGTLSTTNKIVGADSSNTFSYTRFSEDNRSLKDGGWAIVKANVTDEELEKCLTIMDYLYTDEGSVLECFGYNAQASEERQASAWEKVNGKYILEDENGNPYVTIKQNFKDEMFKLTSGTWHDYMTQYWGSCLGVGNIRSNQLEAQLTGAKQVVASKKYQLANEQGAFYLAKTSLSNFLRSVNTTTKTDSDANATIKEASSTLTTWWSCEKTGGWTSPYLQVVYGGWSTSTINSPAGVRALFANSNTSFLKLNAEAWGMKYTAEDQYAFLGLTGTYADTNVAD